MGSNRKSLLNWAGGSGWVSNAVLKLRDRCIMLHGSALLTSNDTKSNVKYDQDHHMGEDGSFQQQSDFLPLKSGKSIQVGQRHNFLRRVSCPSRLMAEVTDGRKKQTRLSPQNVTKLLNQHYLNWTHFLLYSKRSYKL